MEELSIKQRLIIFLRHLGIGQNKFERICGLSNGYISNLKSSPSPEKITKIINVYPQLSRDWLLYGEGEMLRQDGGNARLVGRPVDALPAEIVQVRYFEVTPSATFQEFCSNASERPSSIGVRPEHGEALDDSYCVFEIYGESMAPQIQPHAKVLCQEIQPTRWHTLVGCVVAIAYADRFAIKRIAANDLACGSSITLASDNPEYPARETVALADIRAIFAARRIISSQIH